MSATIPERPAILLDPSATTGQIIDAQIEWEREMHRLAREHVEAALEILTERYGDPTYAPNVIEGWMYEARTTERRVDTSRRKPISASLRREVFEADAYRCVICGGYDHLQVDHIHPVSKGGTNDRENLQTLCRSCNAAKSDKVEVAA